jgi:hypothetical protein
MSADDRGTAGPSEAWQRLGAKVERVGTSLGDLLSEGSVGELREGLTRSLEKHPYGTLAAALGVGFVLGGGLSARPSRRLLWAALWRGLRASALPVLTKELATLFADARARRAQGE